GPILSCARSDIGADCGSRRPRGGVGNGEVAWAAESRGRTPTEPQAVHPERLAALCADLRIGRLAINRINYGTSCLLIHTATSISPSLPATCRRFLTAWYRTALAMHWSLRSASPNGRASANLWRRTRTFSRRWGFTQTTPTPKSPRSTTCSPQPKTPRWWRSAKRVSIITAAVSPSTGNVSAFACTFVRVGNLGCRCSYTRARQQPTRSESWRKRARRKPVV